MNATATGTRVPKDPNDGTKSEIVGWICFGVSFGVNVFIVAVVIFLTYKLWKLNKAALENSGTRSRKDDENERFIEIESLERSLAEAQKNYQQSILQKNQEIHNLRSEITKLKNSVRSSNYQEYQDLKTVIERQGSEITDLRQHNYEKDNKIIYLKKEIENLQSGNPERENQRQNKERMIYDRNINELKYQIERRDKDLSEKDQEITTLKNEVENLESRSTERENQRRSQKRTIDDLNLTIESRDKDIHMLNVAIAGKQENSNQNKEIKNLREVYNNVEHFFPS